MQELKTFAAVSETYAGKDTSVIAKDYMEFMQSEEYAGMKSITKQAIDGFVTLILDNKLDEGTYNTGNYSYRNLRNRIKNKYGTYPRFARHIGKSLDYVIDMLSYKTDFYESDMCKWSDKLDIHSVDDYGNYFFD